MGAAIGTRVPVVQGLDFNAPRVAATTTVAPEKGKANIDDILGLSDSKYDSMKSVGDSGYYLNNGKLYEPYTITQSRPSYGMYYGMGGGSNRAEGTIEVDDQAFKPVTNANVKGFIEGDDGYEISQAYINTQSPKYQGTPQKNLMPLVSLASIPQQDIDTATSSGASRYLTQDTSNTLMRADAEKGLNTISIADMVAQSDPNNTLNPLVAYDRARQNVSRLSGTPLSQIFEFNGQFMSAPELNNILQTDAQATGLTLAEVQAQNPMYQAYQRQVNPYTGGMLYNPRNVYTNELNAFTNLLNPASQYAQEQGNPNPEVSMGDNYSVGYDSTNY